MRVLIIGGCGYIGSAIQNFLEDKYDVTTLDLEWFGNYNISKNTNVRKDFSEVDETFINSYDVIVHTAANSSVPLCKDIHDSFENNVTKFLRLVSKIKKPKFIYASSSCVYVTSESPQKETDFSMPTDGLTLSKTVIDMTMPLLDVEFYGLRFGSVNGWSPNMRTDLMINSMTSSAKKTGKVIVTNGHAMRPIISTNDLARSVLAIIENESDKRGIYNLASFNENILEIGRSVAEYTGAELVDNGNTSTYNFTISSEKFTNTFNFKFEATPESIVRSILEKPYNENWGRRDSK